MRRLLYTLMVYTTLAVSFSFAAVDKSPSTDQKNNDLANKLSEKEKTSATTKEGQTDKQFPKTDPKEAATKDKKGDSKDDKDKKDEKDNDDKNKALEDFLKSNFDPKMAEIDGKFPVGSYEDFLKMTQSDKTFLDAKAKFEQLQAEGKIPSEREFFEQAKAAAPTEQDYYMAKIPYAADGSRSVGEMKIWDADGNKVGDYYWRNGGGDQIGNGNDVTVYHNREGIDGPGIDKGWINQSTNAAKIASGANPPVDIHGRSLSEGYSAGCTALPSGDGFQQWKNAQAKLDYIIGSQKATSPSNPFASLSVGREYAKLISSSRGV